MAEQSSLSEYLQYAGAVLGNHHHPVVQIINCLSEAAVEISELISAGALSNTFAKEYGEQNVDGDMQKELDVHADECFLRALSGTQVAVYGSEEQDEAMQINEAGNYALAIDPLDGSSNIDTNVSIGTIFSILPVSKNTYATLQNSLLQPGTEQIAAGFLIYGPQTALILTVGDGTHIFILCPKTKEYILAYESVSIPEDTSEFAINVSNYRHWDAAVRSYVDDCLDGNTGARGINFNMRWIASLVADCYRILIRGGVFLYPSDQREKYRSGRLRLVYEANPIAFLIEQAGGKATNGKARILELTPESIHQRVPLVFGSKSEVDHISGYYQE